jgi:hypothetical protein
MRYEEELMSIGVEHERSRVIEFVRKHVDHFVVYTSEDKDGTETFTVEQFLEWIRKQ